MTKTSKIKQSNFFCVHISSILFLKTTNVLLMFLFWAILSTDNFFWSDPLFLADIICFKLHSWHWNITLYIFLNLCNLICIFKNVHWIHIVLNSDNVRPSIVFPWLNKRISLSSAMILEYSKLSSFWLFLKRDADLHLQYEKHNNNNEKKLFFYHHFIPFLSFFRC